MGIGYRSHATALIVVIVATIALGAGSSFAQARSGKSDYEENCAPCHGKDGRGHGDALNVFPVNPPDLTQLAKKNGGKFPTEQVYNSIDGRAGIPSHSRFDMPFWGVEFQQSGKEFTPESEAKAKARISNIVAYLETIQTH
jgi:mono/diheme cytochrome c family protein